MAGQGSSKRSGEPQVDARPKRASLRSSNLAPANNPQKTLEDLSPYQIPEQVNLILPSEVLGLQGFSEDVYAQDLFAIFSASPASNGKVEMHKVWFESRKPTIDELWASRHPTRGGYQKTTAAHILRKVLTLSMLLEKATTGMLVRKLQTLLMDHLMLMCITYTSMERPLHYFPDYEARFLSLVETVGTTEPSVPGNIKTSNIPPEVRAKLENLCIDSTTVTPLDQISGNVEGRRMIERAIFLPTRAAHYAAEGLGSQGILLHGPPGTGKTLLAMASAAESEKCKVYSALSSDLIEKWQGTSEQNIVALFTIAAENAPAVIVVDEVEGLCRSRQSKSTSEGSSHRIANAFLASMTKYKGVVVIGTTNLPWELDHAFARRFDTKVHVGLPSEAERLAMTQLRLRRFNHGLSEVEMRRFAQECLGFTGAAVIRTINAALQELVLEFKSATHFRPVEVYGRSMFCPCPPSYPGSIKRSYEEFEREGSVHKVATRKLTIQMLQHSAQAFHAEVPASQRVEEEHKNWASKPHYN